MTTTPALLTPEEAAAIGRCSIKTVRRAYATGALVAYRRRGSRAVLLDRRDVLAWAQGDTVEPVLTTTAGIQSRRADTLPRRVATEQSQGATAARSGGPARFDLSPAALRARRASKAEPLS